MKKLEIEIPNNKEIDWEASAKQKQIVFKNKQLTYKDVCDKLFDKGHYFIDTFGEIYQEDMPAYDLNAATSKHQLKCILAKNKLANVARYLNGNWEEYENDHTSIPKYIIWYNIRNNELWVEESHNYIQYTGNIIFKSKELAQQAIEILGEKTIKYALTPLY